MVRRRKKRKGSCMREEKEDKETVLSVEMRREGGREHAQEGGRERYVVWREEGRAMDRRKGGKEKKGGDEKRQRKKGRIAGDV